MTASIVRQQLTASAGWPTTRSASEQIRLELVWGHQADDAHAVLDHPVADRHLLATVFGLYAEATIIGAKGHRLHALIKLDDFVPETRLRPSTERLQPLLGIS